MTEDRELLEAAAKAAGIKGWWSDDRDFPYFDSDEPWNPLEDDGDALRLAVKLAITMYPPEGDHSEATTTWSSEDSEWITERRTAEPVGRLDGFRAS